MIFNFRFQNNLIKMLKKENCLYQKFYCEENIWHLCQREELVNTQTQILFLLPPKRYIAVWQSRLAKRNLPILWDYHVILMFKDHSSTWRIYDFDTILPFSIEAIDYFYYSLSERYTDYLPIIKVINSIEYITKFHSDRSHMKDKHGKWQAAPPPWKAIINKEGVALPSLLDTKNVTMGKCYSFKNFKKEFDLF